MKLSAVEEFRLLEVFKANAMGSRYWAGTLSDFDYLRANGMVTNGFGSTYGTITVTNRGLNHIRKLIDKVQTSIA